ncbi:MAG: hypothetical protein JWQ29_2786 [Phenylobacterium sp.]|nr:hypothetical protein [Phenylobacterium sp.]
MTPPRHPAFAIVSRFAATLLAGYAATVGMVALGAVLLALGLGMTRAQALVATTMIGFLGYAAIILWGFAEPRLGRIWAILAGVAVLSHIAAIALARLLPPVGTGG